MIIKIHVFVVNFPEDPTNINTYAQTYVRTQLHANISTYIQKYMYIQINNIHSHMHTYKYIHTSICFQCKESDLGLCAC